MKVSEFFGFLLILKQSIKLLPKNGKVMASVMALFLVLYSVAFFFLVFSLKSVITDMFVILKNSSMHYPSYYDPDQSFFKPDPLSQILGQLNLLKKEIALVLVVQITFSVVFFILSILSTTATVLISAMSFKDKTLSLKELCLRMDMKMWKRVRITSRCNSKINSIPYLFFVVALFSPLLFPDNHATTVLAAILLGVLALVFYLYLVVVRRLAVVVSVLEERYCGREALGKAATIVKGKKFHGLMLNTIYQLVFVVVFLGIYKMMQSNGAMESTIYGWLFVFIIVSSLGKLLLDVAYTVLYFECKKRHGEDIELYGSSECDKLLTTHPVEEYL